MLLEKRGRDRLGIIALILEVALDGCLKTQIMYRANLSFRQLSEYTELLQERGLIKPVETDRKIIYRTTKKGMRVLQFYREIRELLESTSSDQTVKIEVHNK